MDQQFVVDIVQLLRRAAKHADCAAELAAQAMYKLAGVRGNSPPAITQKPHIRRSKMSRPKALPANLIRVKLRSDGGSRISANGDAGWPIDLSPRLTELLLFAASAPADPQGVLSYRLVRDAAEKLNANKHGVFHLVYRLRNKLHEHGWDRRLLEVVRSTEGSKLRLLTRKVDVIDGSRAL
jgi:hypothetical protein